MTAGRLGYVSSLRSSFSYGLVQQGQRAGVTAGVRVCLCVGGVGGRAPQVLDVNGIGTGQRQAHLGTCTRTASSLHHLKKQWSMKAVEYESLAPSDIHNLRPCCIQRPHGIFKKTPLFAQLDHEYRRRPCAVLHVALPTWCPRSQAHRPARQGPCQPPSSHDQGSQVSVLPPPPAYRDPPVATEAPVTTAARTCARCCPCVAPASPGR